MIAPGTAIPSIPVRLVTAGETTETTSDAALGGPLTVFFAVPGAFTPGCHVNHLPGFVNNAEKLRAAGVTRIVCLATNDAFVLKAWGDASGAFPAIEFLADGNGDLARALGLDKDLSANGMGLRYQRAAGIARNGKIEHVFVEDGPGINATGAPAVLMALEASA